MLSIVLSGRNDNHNGDFDLRAEYAICHNVALLNKLAIPFEIDWVEWNPLSTAPFFANKLRQWCTNTRVYVVPPEIHNHLCDNPSIGVMQFHAKNVGLRRAKGEWVLSMNADTYLTPEVLKPLADNSLDSSLFYMATRLDFNSRHLEEKPSCYPISSLKDREITLVSKVDIPRTFGSVGDFSLLHRDQWFNLQGHYEGIRFSNHHMDTLLCRQWMHLGGSFHELGNIYHADHKDSWNNFALGDDRKHHGGCNYDCNLISIPYANSREWGLAGYSLKYTESNIAILTPPPNLMLRQNLPAEIVIPEELGRLTRYTEAFMKAIEDLSKASSRVVIYGLGDQVKQALKKGLLDKLQILGFVDDSSKPADDLPFTQISVDAAVSMKPDAVLIGSMFWVDQLREKASVWMPDKARIYPII